MTRSVVDRLLGNHLFPFSFQFSMLEIFECDKQITIRSHQRASFSWNGRPKSKFNINVQCTDSVLDGLQAMCLAFWCLKFAYTYFKVKSYKQH